VLSRWRKEYQEKGEAAFQVTPSGEGTAQELKIAELERFCGQLALENQVLKKTLQSMGSKNATL
jgi:transposase-like protein